VTGFIVDFIVIAAPAGRTDIFFNKLFIRFDALRQRAEKPQGDDHDQRRQHQFSSHKTTLLSA
jgi:hypothetical protein